MTWARFDDRFPSHLKVLRLSDAAFRLFVTSVCFSCQHGTDGAIDEGIPEALTRAPVGRACFTTIAELERFGLWERTDTGWMIHDFLDWNPSAEQVVVTREARSAAGRLGGQRSGKTRANTKQPTKQTVQQNRSKDEANGSANTEAKPQAKTNPVPVPVPTPPDGGAPKPPPPPEAKPKQTPAPDDGPIPLRSLAAALQTPVVERAQRLQAEPHTAQWCEPHRWPELIAVNQAWADAFRPGKPTPRLQRFEIDPVVKTLIEAFAAGYDQPELERIAASFGRGDFVREAEAEGKRPSLAWLKGDALRNEAERVASVKPLSATVQRALAAARAVT